MARNIAVHVLVIDDDASACRRLSAWLSDAQYEPAAFLEAEAALAQADAREHLLALVDMQLGDLSGLDVLERLRAASPRTRAVAMAAFPDEALRTAAAEAGAGELLEKPVGRAQMLAALERQLIELGIAARTEPDFNRRLGRRLRALRREQRRTLADVAGASGITTAQLSQIELGRNAASTWTLARVSAALRVGLGEVFRCW